MKILHADISIKGFTTFKLTLSLMIILMGFCYQKPVFALPDSDLQVFRACLLQQADIQCAAADFDGDGIIDLFDYFQILSVFKYDLNGDKVVDVSSASGNTDLAILKNCIGLTLNSECAGVDFNLDNVIDNLDQSLLYDAVVKFDLDGDLRAEYYVDSKPVFSNVNNQTIAEKQKLAFYIVAYDNDNEEVTYQTKGLSGDAKIKQNLFGDFNEDGVVNPFDVDIFETYKLNHIEVENTQDAKYDLNNDKIIDGKDISLLRSKLGKRIPALFVTWKPEDEQSGIYEITTSASSVNIDGVTVTTDHSFTITVVDIHAAENYYDYDDVLVVINNNSIASKQIGAYFIQQRQILYNHVIYINSPTSETINWTTYVNDIATPIEEFLTKNRSKTKINYIVTTKGVPLRIFHANYPLPIIGRHFPNKTVINLARSVDAQIATLAKSSPAMVGPYYSGNSYYKSNMPFSSEMYKMYLVTRLTGYTISDAKALVDRATNAVQNGLFVFDIDPSKDYPGFQIGNDWMRNANNLLLANNRQTIFDETTTFLTNKMDVLGYVSWGSNDAYHINNAIPNHTWLPGGIAETFVSTSARTFTAPPIYGQSLVADLITEGVTGVKGYTFEPYLAAMAQPDILFLRYSDGFTLADSYYAATFPFGWQSVIVGDPKAKISPKINSWNREGARDIAYTWISKFSSTYQFDGMGLSLIKTDSRLCAYCYRVTYSFTSKYPGYGDRSDKNITLDATVHNIVIEIEFGKVTRAINDFVYDEINQDLL